MIDYQFLTTSKLSEALEYRYRLKNLQLLAGGTDLLVDIYKKSSRLPKLEYILDISNIKQLKFIRERDNLLEIGCLVTHATLIDNPTVQKYFPLLVKAARTIGSTQIRNRGTIGGNINNASPAADLLPPLLALRGAVKLESQEGVRVVPLSQFLTGPYQTCLRQNEMMTALQLPISKRHYYGSFQRIGRRKAVTIARLSLALVIRVTSNGICRDARLVPGAATPYPRSLAGVEQALNNQAVTMLDPEEIGSLAAEEMVEITGERWSTPYKKPALASLVKRAVLEIVEEVAADEKD